MAGVLQFTLGLEVADFLSKANISSTAITGLAGAGELLRKALAGVFAAFDQGAALEHLSRRTGESVGKLYQLQEAFKACGVDAESLPPMLFMMQKALGGVNEMGESTAGVFQKLGLHINALMEADPAEAFATIMQRLSGLSSESAAKAASMIFGRMGASMAVQISRSPQEFREAFADAARQAAILQHASAVFAHIHGTILAIKREITGFWAGFAEGVAPAVQTVLDWLRKIDLTGFGERIGQWVRALTESFSSGGLGEMISLSLEAGLEQGAYYAEKFVVTFSAGLAAALPEALAAGFQASAGVAEIFGGLLYNKAGQVAIREERRMIAEIEAGKGAGRGQTPEQRAALIAQHEAMIDTLEGGLHDMESGLRKSRSARASAAAEDIGAAMHGAMSSASAVWSGFGPAPRQAIGALQAKMAEILGRFGTTISARRRAGEDDVNFGAGLMHRTEGNVFEKIGFVMGGGGGPIHDVARNTRSTVEVLSQIQAIITGRGNWADMGGDAVHQPL